MSGRRGPGCAGCGGGVAFWGSDPERKPPALSLQRVRTVPVGTQRVLVALAALNPGILAGAELETRCFAEPAESQPFAQTQGSVGRLLLDTPLLGHKEAVRDHRQPKDAEASLGTP